MVQTRKRTKSAKRTARNKPPKIRPVIPVLTRRWRLLLASCFALLAALTYAPSHDYDFVYDDDAVIKDNRFVKRGLDGLNDIWSTTYFEGYDPDIKARAYRPVPLSLLALEVELFDHKPATEAEQRAWQPNPHIYHRSNIALYALTGFVLFLFLARVFGRHSAFIPIAVTLLFVLHPIHLEVIANIKSHDTMLGFLGWITAAWLWLRYIDTGKVWQLPVALLAFTVGIFSKEEVLTTLATLPMLLYIFRKDHFRKQLKTAALFLVPTAIFLMVRSSILGGINEGVELKIIDNSLLGAQDFLAARLPSNLYSLGYFFKQSIFPNTLLSDYSYSTLPLVGWANWRPYVSLATYALIGAGLFYGIKKRNALGFGLWHFLVSISIFSSVIITNVSVYNDRFLYNASLGVVVALVWLLSLLLKKSEGNFGKWLAANWLPVALVAILAVAGMTKIQSHLPKWQDRYVLFAYETEQSPENARMLKNHGGSLARLAMAETDGTRKRELATEAAGILQRSLAIYPRIATGHIHLANMYVLLNDYPAAENSFKNALAISPSNHHAKINLANVLYRQSKYDEGLTLIQTMPKERFTKNDYYVAALLHERSSRGDATLAAEYRRLAGR